MEKVVKVTSLLVRCIAFREGDQWVGICLNFDLAVQGKNFKEVRTKLDSQIHTYVLEALAGQDRQHADVLLERRAPLRYWAMYYGLMFVHKLGITLRKDKAREYRSPMPLAPA